MTTLSAFLLPLILDGPCLGTPPAEHARATAMWTQEAEFTPPSANDLDFGPLVALGPATIAAAGQVGDASMVYVYDRAAGAWAEPAELSFPEDILIRAVGLNGDNMVTLVTYTAAYTSERLDSGWSEPRTVLTLPDGDSFGRAHITDDVMVLGTYENSGPCPLQQTRILVFRRAGQAWAADGEIAAEGCADESPGHYSFAADGDRLVSIMAGEGAQGGVARVYRRSGEATWEIETTLEAPSIAADGGYTEAAIQGDTLVLGAQYANDERGRADVYVERDDGWHLQQSIHGEGQPVDEGLNGGAGFGGPLAIDGDLLAIGSPNESSEGLLESGTVRVYGYAGEWVEEASLSRRGPNTVFGTGLALRGSRLVVGSSWFNEPSGNSVHVFTRQGDAPTGMCLDDSECGTGTCTDGICLPADDVVDPKTGCGCSSNAGDAPVAALLAFMFLPRRRRSTRKVQPITSRKMRTRQALAALLLLGSAACGDDVDHTRCTLTMSLTGDITASTPEEIDCSASYDGPLLVMTFEPFEDEHHPISTFSVWLDEVGKGQTGEFSATALVISPEGWTWKTDACSVTITKYAYSGRPCEKKGLFHTGDDPTCDGYDVYRIIGHGVCNETAVQSNGEGAIDIGSFEFVTRLWWPR